MAACGGRRAACGAETQRGAAALYRPPAAAARLRSERRRRRRGAVAERPNGPAAVPAEETPGRGETTEGTGQKLSTSGRGYTKGTGPEPSVWSLLMLSKVCLFVDPAAGFGAAAEPNVSSGSAGAAAAVTCCKDRGANICMIREKHPVMPSSDSKISARQVMLLSCGVYHSGQTYDVPAERRACQRKGSCSHQFGRHCLFTFLFCKSVPGCHLLLMTSHKRQAMIGQVPTCSPLCLSVKSRQEYDPTA